MQQPEISIHPLIGRLQDNGHFTRYLALRFYLTMDNFYTNLVSRISKHFHNTIIYIKVIFQFFITQGVYAVS